MVIAICALPIAAVLAGAFWQQSALRRMADKIDHLQDICRSVKPSHNHRDGDADG